MDLTVLIDTLSREAAAYESLTEASVQKRKAIIENNLEDIRMATALEQNRAAGIRALEKDRRREAGEIAREMNVAEDDITLNYLEDTIKDTLLAPRLKDAACSLRTALENLRAVNGHNNALIKNALEYIDFSVNALRSSACDAMPEGGNLIEIRN